MIQQLGKEERDRLNDERRAILRELDGILPDEQLEIVRDQFEEHGARRGQGPLDPVDIPALQILRAQGWGGQVGQALLDRLIQLLQRFQEIREILWQ